MWTYLCVFRENLPKGTKKSVTEEGLGPFDPRFRKTMLYPTELLSQNGAQTIWVKSAPSLIAMSTINIKLTYHPHGPRHKA